MDCVFCKIRDKEILKEFIYEDEDVMVFPDISPVKPVHLLVIPKEHIEDFLDVESSALFGKIGKVLQIIIKKYELSDKGYRILVNGGGAQVVSHLHFHLMGPLGKAVKV